MKVWNRMSTFAVGCVLLAGCGANGPEPAEPITEQEQQEGETVETGGVVATLPPRAVDGSSCIETPTTPALCDWLHSTDGLYFGELKALELTATPAVSAHGGETFVTCTTEIANHNLRIVLEVDESVLGIERAEVAVLVGTHQLDEWSVRPMRDEQGEIAWFGDGPGLQVGDRLGLAIHEGPDGVLGLLGEPLMTTLDDGSIVVQDAGECFEPAATGLAGSSVAELRDEAGSCTPTAQSDARRANLDASWEGRPTWASAAVCFDGGQ